MKVLLSLLLALTCFQASANDGQSSGNNLSDFSLEELLNLKVRLSLKKALEIKRDALISKDTIVSEDIADFVDLNVAEAIQRMPGVAITREVGEGRRISLRGVGANFTRVKINGMETLTTSTSPMDSRNTLDHDRAFDFNVLVAEMFSQIDIEKTYSAQNSEGGIGGSVALHTPRPFDIKGARWVLNGSAGDNSYRDKYGQRLLVLGANTWDTFGVLGSLVYTERQTAEKGFNTVRWRARSGVALSSDLESRNRYNDATIQDPTTINLIENGDLWFSRSNRYSVWESNQERLGSNLSFQYIPNPDFELTFTALFMEMKTSRDEYHLGTGRSSSVWPGVLENVQYNTNKDEIEILYAEYSDVELRSEHRVDKLKTTYQVYQLHNKWRINDRFSLNGLIGTSDSTFKQPTLDKVFVISNPGTVTTDFRQDRFYGDIQYQIDTANPENWRTWDLYHIQKADSNRFDNIQLNAEINLSPSASIQTGISWQEFENILAQAESSYDFVDDNSQDFSMVFRGSADVNWVVADVNKAFNRYGVNPSLDLPQGQTINEQSTGLFVLYKKHSKLMGKDFSFDLGARYVKTEANLSNRIDNVPVELSGSYNNLLPSLSTRLEINRNLVYRLNINKNISRPYLFEQRIELYEFDPDAQTIGLNGNPNLLMPYESLNLDSSLEWYFDKESYVSLGLFYKDITGFTDLVTDTRPFSETNLPAALLPSGQNSETLYQFSYLSASESAVIQGFELAAQYQMSFLPSPYDGFGVSANVTLADGTATYRDVQGSGMSEEKTFPGLSRVSGNFTLLYEKENWGARLSTAFRGRYIFNVEAGLTDEDERGFHSTQYIDASVYYDLNSNLKLTLEASNLNNQREEQYSDSNDRAYNTTTHGRSVYLGFNFKY